MRRYLVCYDYGTGGLWWWITANSPDEITAKFREVVVFERPPTWWNDDIDAQTPRRGLRESPDDALASLAR
jgi:hypothetical protein